MSARSSGQEDVDAISDITVVPSLCVCVCLCVSLCVPKPGCAHSARGCGAGACRR